MNRREQSPPAFPDLGILIVRTRKLVWNAASRELEKNGVSMLAWVLVGHLVRQGPGTQKDIAEAVGQHSAGLSRLVDELAKAGMVRRHQDSVDRRRSRVEVTAKGRALYQSGLPHVMGALTEALNPLSKEEQKQLRHLLEKLLANERDECLAPTAPARRRSSKGRTVRQGAQHPAAEHRA